jgi:hypothetical protein
MSIANIVELIIIVAVVLYFLITGIIDHIKD